MIVKSFCRIGGQSYTGNASFSFGPIRLLHLTGITDFRLDKTDWGGKAGFLLLAGGIICRWKLFLKALAFVVEVV